MVLPALVSPGQSFLTGENFRFVDARPGATGWAAGHLPGAIHADLDRHLAAPAPHPERGGRHPLPDPRVFTSWLSAMGIGPATRVVVYDDQGGANAAARLWWMLRSLGHQRVSVLDGGLAAARAAGFPLETGEPRVESAEAWPATEWQLPLVRMEEVDRLRTEPDAMVLDVRAAFRYRGEGEPLDPVAGHIPGARNLPFTENLGPDGRFVPQADLRRRYLELLGDVKPERLAVHCGSGVTACHTLLALEHAGLAGASLYVGSWSEWCRSDRPRAQGERP